MNHRPESLRVLTVMLLPALASAFVAACGDGRAAPAAAGPTAPPEVKVVTVTPERVPITTEWVATLDGNVNAEIRPQVSGYLVRRNYEEGAVVKKGQVLFEIDPRPFEAALAQAQANLGQAQAQLGKTERDLARDKPLADQRAIAQSQLDDDVQANLAAKATVTAAEAAVDTAQLNLGFTKVTSLIDGVAAIATAQIGDLVGPQTLLTTVSQINPIKAYFPLGEREYLDLAPRINHRNGGSGGAPWRADAGLTLVLSNGTTYPHKGTFLAADRAIDPKTGTIRISATFPNPDGILRPGQYGHVRAETALREDALLVPQRAVSELQGVYQVRVVNADNTVTTRAVTPGARVGSRWVIESGLQPNTRVVVEGPSTKDGTTVAAKPYVDPAAGR